MITSFHKFLLYLIFVPVNTATTLMPKNATKYLSAITVIGDAESNAIFVNMKLSPKITCASNAARVADVILLFFIETLFP